MAPLLTYNRRIANHILSLTCFGVRCINACIVRINMINIGALLYVLRLQSFRQKGATGCRRHALALAASLFH